MNNNLVVYDQTKDKLYVAELKVIYLSKPFYYYSIRYGDSYISLLYKHQLKLHYVIIGNL